MNYHVEHHMFPLVPYHALPGLHAMVKEDCPEPCPSLIDTWREIVPALFRQAKDPAYHIKRRLPEPKRVRKEAALRSVANPDADGWIDVCSAAILARNDVIRFDHSQRTFAVYRDAQGTLYATDGFCTHGNTHLSEGLLIGETIECPKHNGRFNLADGSPARAPICRGLTTYPVTEREGKLLINLARPGGAGARAPKSLQFRVVSNRSVATFIKELVLEPAGDSEMVAFTPGDYLQLEIPEYAEIRFSEFEIPEPFATVWRTHHLFDLVARNPKSGCKNNYSLASNQEKESALRFNVRIATPPPGQDCGPGVGSSYAFNLKPGDLVSALGPFGDFHIKPTQREMVYIGGGAGMAPLRAHLSHLLETEKCARRISFWYGARSKQEIFYQEYFQELVDLHPNFTFSLALSAPLSEDRWSGPVGLVHDVVFEKHLSSHVNPSGVEYYLCGPPLMVKACTAMLRELGVPATQIAYDEF
jgi:MocE subfamily Rieske [2Fe-2S] domain protein